MKRKETCKGKFSTIKIIHNYLESSDIDDSFISGSFELFDKQRYERPKVDIDGVYKTTAYYRFLRSDDTFLNFIYHFEGIRY